VKEAEEKEALEAEWLWHAQLVQHEHDEEYRIQFSKASIDEYASSLLSEVQK
jgi:hypothetical protein